MNPKLEKLRAEQERVQRELEQAKHQQQRLENRLSYMNTGERRARAHRLITRGAAIESILPATQPMTERAFYELMEAVFSLPEVQTVIQSRLPKADGDP